MPSQHPLRLNFDESGSPHRRGEVKVCLITRAWQNSPEPVSHPASGVNFPCVTPGARQTLLFKSASVPLTPPTPRSLGWFKLPRALVGPGRPSTHHLLGVVASRAGMLWGGGGGCVCSTPGKS